MTDLPPQLVGDAPGFAAFTTAEPYAARLLTERVQAVRGGQVIDLDRRSAALVWGGAEARGVPWRLVLGATARTHQRALTDHDVRRLLDEEDAAPLLTEVVPPFAAVGWRPRDGSIAVVVDWLGFRHLYLASGPGWSGVSSSAATLGGCLDGGIDRTVLLVQSRLGWQLGDRTLHAGVRKIGAGVRAELRAGAISETVVVSTAVAAESRRDRRPDDWRPGWSPIW